MRSILFFICVGWSLVLGQGFSVIESQNRPQTQHQPQVIPSAQQALPGLSSQNLYENILKNLKNFQQTERFAKVLENPAVKVVVKALENEKIRSSIENLSTFKDWKKLLLIQIATILGMMIFKAHRNSKFERDEWGRRLWFQTWTFFFGWFLLIIAVPSLVIGADYRNLLSGIYETVSAAYF